MTKHINENDEVETIIEELEEVKGSMYQQAMNERAIMSLTLGILSVLFIWLFAWASPVLGIVGIILGAQARKEAKSSSGTTSQAMAVIGLTCSVVGLAVSAVKIILYFVA